jgi:hypothetical protein
VGGGDLERGCWKRCRQHAELKNELLQLLKASPDYIYIYIIHYKPLHGLVGGNVRTPAV